MAIGVRKVTAYQSSDGRTWATKKEAEAAEAVKTLEQLVVDNGLCRNGFDRDDAETVYRWMLEQGWPLINALSAIARRGKP